MKTQLLFILIIFVSVSLVIQQDNFTNYQPDIEYDEVNNVTCLVPKSCKNSKHCLNCSHIDNVTYSNNVNNSKHVTYAVHCNNVTNSRNLTNVYDSDNCTFCSYSSNIKDGYDVHNSNDALNCTRCQYVQTVQHCQNCTRVNYSKYVEDLYESYHCEYTKRSDNCNNCYNVTNSKFCTNCRRCVDCRDCTRCIGYRCFGEDCRNSYWRWKYIEPPADDTKSWACSNPITTPYRFLQDGYDAPTYLKSAEVQQDLQFCTVFNGIRSCCTKQGTDIMKQIFDHYKKTLQMRADKKIQQIRVIFDQYRNLSYRDVPNANKIKSKIKTAMKVVKERFIFTLAQNMANCSKMFLEHISGMMCLGCMPDWRWHKYIPLNIRYDDDKDFFDFNPDKDIESFLVDLEDTAKILAKKVKISRPNCEETYSTCRRVVEFFYQFRNRSSQAIG